MQRAGAVWEGGNAACSAGAALGSAGQRGSPVAACADRLDFQVAGDALLLGSSADLHRSQACTALPRTAGLATLPLGSLPQDYSEAV